jgi:CRISPR-associated endonuclease Csn1
MGSTSEYADGDKERIGKITIEVNRDLREMSGMTAKEKAMDLGSRIANHHAVAEKLEKAFAEERNGKAIPITASLIRKARVAEDLGWKCPYTGADYEPKDLVTRRVDKDHIVPRSQRPSDGLDSLVITFSEINKWKGNRTAWQFVSEEQDKPVPSLPNLSIESLTRYKQFVEGLESYKGHEDDKRRKKKRKELMLLPKYEEKEFTPRDLTHTSQLVRLGAQVLRRNLPHLTTGDVTSLPGSVTGTVRKAWKVLGCMETANAAVMEDVDEFDEKTGQVKKVRRVKKKDDIRSITHLHHALDACVLVLASRLIPNNGRVWELIVKRNPNDLEKRQLEALGVFGFNAEKRFELHDLDNKLKEQIRQRLAEKRVVQHIPARMDGMPVDLNMWRLKDWRPDGKAILEKHSRDASGNRKLDTPKAGADNKDRLIGWRPENGNGKLKQLKAVLITNENFGVALVKPQPVIIPFHKVWKRLQELPKNDDGTKPKVIRAGALIEVPKGKHKGSWRIFSIKNNANGVAFALGQRDGLHPDNSKQNVLVRQLLKDGAAFPKVPLTGVAACPTTSSALTPPIAP